MKTNNRANEQPQLEADSPALEKTLQRLQSVRDALIRLHKILMGYQQQLWEQKGGRADSSYELLNVVMHDREFAWLHRLSQFIVQIDELLAAGEEAQETDALALVAQVKALVSPSESGDEYQRKYFEALQQSPDVVLAHSEVVGLLGKR